MVGQKEIVAALKGLVDNDRVAHAYIFSGPKGIGKRTAAGIFSSLLLCENPTRGEACGSCMPCNLLSAGSNPDFYVIDTENSSISVDEIRKLQEDTIVRPMYSRYKVYLIAEADKMTVQAQNCLLKTLEEPHEYVVIILTVSNFSSLLETIRSRTVRYSFRKNTPQEVKAFLEARYGGGLRSIDFVTSYSDGNVGAAIEMINSEEFFNLREKAVELAFRLKDARLLDVFDAYHFFEEGKGSIDMILDIMLLLYRDLLIAKKAQKENILINSDKKDIILNNAGQFSTAKLIKNIEIIEYTRKNIKQNANYQLSIEVMLMKLQEAED